jgi:hypothetical protein
MGLGGGLDPPTTNDTQHLHTQHPRVTEFIWCGRKFGQEPMLSLSPWGGLGEPGDTCVKWGGKESTLGAQAPTRGALPKRTGNVLGDLGTSWAHFRSKIGTPKFAKIRSVSYKTFFLHAFFVLDVHKVCMTHPCL